MPNEYAPPSRAGAGLGGLAAALSLAFLGGPAEAQADVTATYAAAVAQRWAVVAMMSYPPDAYREPNLLVPSITFDSLVPIVGLPVRQQPVNAGLFGAGCAQCHRLAGPLPAGAGAPPDVFDTLAPAPTTARATAPTPAGFVRITDDPAREEYPSWSPDGRGLLYERRGDDGRWGLWLVAADGTGRRPLVTTGNAGWGEWSPDGRFIAYWAAEAADGSAGGAPGSTTDGAGGGNVWLVEVDGGGAPTRLTTAAATAFPVWSPDGRRIAVQARDAAGAWAIVIVNPQDGASRSLTPPGQDMPSRPQFSPDGRRIAYQVADGARFGLWQLEFPLRPDGAPDYDAPPRSTPASTLLPMDIGMARANGVWSPDGDRLALQMLVVSPTPDGRLVQTYKTWTTDPNGAHPQVVIPRATLADRSPSWSPSGRWLVQWSWNHDLTASVWLARADDSRPPVDLTAALGGNALYPAWSPDGRRIAFSADREGSFDVWIVDVAAVVAGFEP